MKRCAILSMDSLEGFEAYDHLIEPHMHALGWQVDTVSWRNVDVDWSTFDVVLIRTPWDYQDEPEAFLQVLRTIEAAGCRLENSLPIVKWNIDKIYLQELASLGVKLIPTLWCPRLSTSNLTVDAQGVDNWRSELSDLKQDSTLKTLDLVIKPRISANADNTFWLSSNKPIAFDLINEALINRDFMVQPFVTSIVTEGEYSLFYFNGVYSHAILKSPKEHDFRVQEEHGGRLSLIEPEPTLLDAAEVCIQAIAKLHQTPMYVRLDLVRLDQEFALMEAELIEPSLYFNMDENSAARFAEQFVKRVEQDI